MRLHKQKPPTWTQKEPLTHCPTHLFRLLDDGTCPWDADPLVTESRLYAALFNDNPTTNFQRYIVGATEETAVSKFKIGDRVRVISGSDAVENGVGEPVEDGDVGTIWNVLANGLYRVALQGGSEKGWWYEGENLELLHSDTDKHDDTVSLNPDDPFERVIIDMVETNRRKRADYAVDGSPWSNFDDVANSLGITGFAPVDSANFNIEQKSARLRSLRKNGRMDDPANESVADTYLDRAVYSVIALAMHKYPEGRVA